MRLHEKKIWFLSICENKLSTSVIEKIKRPKRMDADKNAQRRSLINNLWANKNSSAKENNKISISFCLDYKMPINVDQEIEIDVNYILLKPQTPLRELHFDSKNIRQINTSKLGFDDDKFLCLSLTEVIYLWKLVVCMKILVWSWG